jgi:hypothetical protein
MQEQGVCVVQHEYVIGRKEACLEGDNVCCFEDWFLVKKMGKAWDAKSFCHELVRGGCRRAVFITVHATGANVIADGGER